MPYVKKFMPNEHGRYQCPQCPRDFERIHQLTGHMNGHKGTKRSPRVVQPNAQGKPATPPPLKYCPQCGCNLSVIAAALQFMAEKG